MIWTVFLLLFVLVNCQKINHKNDKLIFAQVIFRHGSRSIQSSYPNDPYKSRQYWPQGFGQLTTVGRQQEYELGQFLRRRYHKLLGSGSHARDKVYAVSTEIQRTIDSARLVLDGLFQDQNHQIQVNVIPRKKDHLLIFQPACDRYGKKLNEYMKSSKIKGMTKQYESLFHNLEVYSGKPIRSIGAVRNLHDTLYVERFLNLPLPNWVQDNFASMEYLGAYWLKLITGTNELKKLYSGFLLKEILEHFEKKANSRLSPNRSMWLYSAHDVTIAGMLNSLGVFEPHIPQYASSLLFELYESNGHHYIQLFYRHSNMENPNPINIPHCGTKCSLSKFRELYSNILPASFERACRIRK